MLVLAPTRLEIARLFPELGEPPKVRVPVAWRSRPDGEAVDVAWCGFGLAAAAAGAATLLAGRHDDACLVGFAGTLDVASLRVGDVVAADHVEVDGLGLPSKTGNDSLDAELARDPSLAPPEAPHVPGGLRRLAAVGGLLSVAVPSADPAEAARRAAAHPRCLAEEMEAHGALHAAGMLGRRLAVVRGVTNVAGEREKRRWDVAGASSAIRAALEAWLFEVAT